MKTNLSSQIKLDRVARRYYAPSNEIELAALTREEKIYTRIFETADDGSAYLAAHIAEAIKRNTSAKGSCVIALGAGRSTHAVYSRLIEIQSQRVFPAAARRPFNARNAEKSAPRPCEHPA